MRRWRGPRARHASGVRGELWRALRAERGIVERADMVICGDPPPAEMPELKQALPFSRAEQDLMTDWADPASRRCTRCGADDWAGRVALVTASAADRHIGP